MKNINWIASYPKSGNTMVRLFLCAYLFTETGKISDFKIINAIKKFNTDSVFKKYKKNFDLKFYNSKPNEISKYFIHVQNNLYTMFKKNIFFFKTHNALSNYGMENFTNDNITRSVIYIVRDPRSVLLSEMYHYNRLSQEETFMYMKNPTRFSLGVKEEMSLPEIISSWKINYISWKKFIIENKNGIIFRYEDLVNNPEYYFKQMIIFLGKRNNFQFEKNKFYNSLSSIKFDNLKNLEKSIGFSERTSNKENFFRKGLVDEWHGKINNDIKKKVEDIFYDEMVSLNYI